MNQADTIRLSAALRECMRKDLIKADGIGIIVRAMTGTSEAPVKRSGPYVQGYWVDEVDAFVDGFSDKDLKVRRFK